MKFLHLADLHIGKKLNEYPLYEDQRYVLKQAINLAKEEDVDAIVIAGDIYDSSAPTAEAMDFYDEMLMNFFALGKPILMISGNHDSAERLHVASSILKRNEVYIVTKVEESAKPIEIGGVRFHLLPYFRPSDVNRAFNTDVKTFEEAMKVALQNLDLDGQKANVLVTHQSILPIGEKTEGSGSESGADLDAYGNVGGTEVIDVSLLSSFDYLALGHIHKAQFIAKNARYPGALLKYHEKEAMAEHSFTIVSIEGKDVNVEAKPLVLLHDLVKLENTLDKLLQGNDHRNDYVHARLLDDVAIDSPYDKLKARYPFFLGLEYARTAPVYQEEADFDNVEEIDKNKLFATFAEKYGNRTLDEEETAFIKKLFEEDPS